MLLSLTVLFTQNNGPAELQAASLRTCRATGSTQLASQLASQLAVTGYTSASVIVWCLVCLATDCICATRKEHMIQTRVAANTAVGIQPIILHAKGSCLTPMMKHTQTALVCLKSTAQTASSAPVLYLCFKQACSTQLIQSCPSSQNIGFTQKITHNDLETSHGQT